MRVVIVGLGGVGRHLLEMLVRRADHELVVVDHDPERCRRAAEHTDALVLEGDGTDPELLREARLGEADALVACTGFDATNTVIGLLGRHFEVPNIVVKLDESGLAAACSEAGVHTIVAPKIAAAAEIRDAIIGEGRATLSLLTQGGMRTVQLEVRGDDGHRLGELDLPPGVLAIAVLRGQRALFPHDDLRFEEGDSVAFLVEDEDAFDRVRERVERGFG